MKSRSFALKISVLALGALALASPLAVSRAQDFPAEPAAAARLASLTNQLVAAIGDYRRAGAAQRGTATGKLKTLAAERRALLLASLERQPGMALRRSLPGGLTAGLPAEVRALLEQEVELTGRVVNLHSDDMATGTCSDKYFVELTSGPRPLQLRLHAADKPDRPGSVHPAAQFVGQVVTLRGLQLDSQLLITEAGAIDGSTTTSSGTTAGAGSVAIAGAQDTLVLTANFQDKALTCSTGAVHSTVFGTTNSVHDLYRETSNGNVTFAGATYGPYQIPYSSTTCDFSAWSSELDRIATQQGINLSQYPRKVYVFPNNACAAAGASTMGGSTSTSWIFLCGLADLYAHELGHGLGFGHSRTPTGEYSDTSDVMGYSGQPLRQLNAANKTRAGWFPSTHVREVTGSGTFALSPTAAVSPPNPQALVLAKPDTGDNYYVSLRQRIGYDANLSSTYMNRVSIHRGSTSATPTTLLATLDPGQSYADAVNGYTFTVNSIVSDAASVSVSMAAPVCVRAAPTVTVTPVSQSGAPGAAVGYSVTVKSNNNSGCGSTTYAFTPGVPGGFGSSNAPATLALDAGSSASTVWTVTSPTSGVSEQSYPVSLTAYDAGATSSAGTAQASYLVTAVADSQAPSVSITSPGDGTSGLSGTVTVAASASDNVAVAKVEFAVNGKLAATDTSAPYSFNWSTRKLSGSHTVSAKAFDAAGNASAPYSITVSVGGSGGGGGGGGGKRK